MKKMQELIRSLNIPKLGPVIAIDGPAGTGKSSVTRRLAEILGYVHVDTGALYRAIGFLALEKKSALLSSEVERNTEEIPVSIARTARLEFRRVPGKNPVNRLFANEKDITDFIRTPIVTLESSRVSSMPEVRTALLALQRRLGCQGHTLLEGRDIGTVIFPDADLKFFLTASLEERAKRRLTELETLGSNTPSFQEVREQIRDRDHDDSTRTVAPLKKAPDAIEVDTSRLTLDEVVAYMISIVNQKLIHEKKSG
jgi:cytidylate kinase